MSTLFAKTLFKRERLRAHLRVSGAWKPPVGSGTLRTHYPPMGWRSCLPSRWGGKCKEILARLYRAWLMLRRMNDVPTVVARMHDGYCVGVLVGIDRMALRPARRRRG